MNNLLCLNNVNMIYHSPTAETLALENIDFCLGENEFLSLVGPSG